MRFGNRASGWLVALWMVSSPVSVAWSVDPVELIRQGVELRRRADDAGALRLFEQAYKIDQSPRALAQMGLAEQALGRWMAASEHLHQATEATQDPWISKNRSSLRDAIKRVDEHIGWIEIAEGPPGAEVRLDGVVRGNLPLSGRLASTTGTVLIELVSPGRYPQQRTTIIRAGEVTRESFARTAPVASQPAPAVPAAAPSPSVAPPATPSPSSAVPSDSPPPAGDPNPLVAGAPPTPADAPTPGAGPSWRIPVSMATGALAVVGLTLGVVEHVTWQNKVDAFEAIAACGESAPDHGGGSCNEIYSAGHRAKILTFVGYGAGAALAATAAIVYFGTAPAGAGNDQRIACAFNPVAFNMSCALRF